MAFSREEVQEALRCRHTSVIQERLNKGRVAISGLGGLGSNVASALARIGVGHLHLIDFDRVDLTNLEISGKEAENLLDLANITANKNTIPNDPRSAFVTSGVRLGTAAVTSRGLNEADMDVIAEAVAMMLKEGEAAAPKAGAMIQELTERYPLCM